MSSSGTYTWDLEVAEALDECFERCGIMPTDIQERHLQSFRRSANLWLQQLTARGPLQFAIDQQSQALSASTASYALATGTIDVLNSSVFVRDSNSDDRPLGRINRADYTMYANKDSTASQGPSVFWVDRTASLIYVWPALATGGGALTLYYNRARRIADISTTYSQNVDIRAYWLEAFCAGVAEALAVKWAPERLAWLSPLADKAFKIASDEDKDRGDFTLGVDLSAWAV